MPLVALMARSSYGECRKWNAPCMARLIALPRLLTLHQGHGNQRGCHEVERTLETDSELEVRVLNHTGGDRMTFRDNASLTRVAAGRDVAAICSPHHKTVERPCGICPHSPGFAPRNSRPLYIPLNSIRTTTFCLLYHCSKTIRSWSTSPQRSQSSTGFRQNRSLTLLLHPVNSLRPQQSSPYRAITSSRAQVKATSISLKPRISTLFTLPSSPRGSSHYYASLPMVVSS